MKEEVEKTFEMIEERGLVRHRVKKLMKVCRAFYDKYKEKMEKAMPTNTWYLLQDWCNLAQEKAEIPLAHLRYAMQDYLANQPEKHRNHDIIAQGMTAQIMSQIIHDTWNDFFKSYKALCGLNFEKDFTYADMSPYMRTFQTICDEISHGNPSVDFGNDKRCVDAFRALKNKMDNEDFFDKSAEQAVLYNRSFRDDYLKSREILAQKRQDKERNEFASKLGEKFNVSRL